MSHLAILGAAAILASGLSYTVGRIQGSAASQLACERQKVTDSATVLQDYRAAVEAQGAEDRAMALRDAALIDKATTKLNESARKLERLKAAAPPAGNCVLSPEWIRAYDEAR